MAEAETGGKLTRKQWIIIGGAGAAYVGYRWWKSRQSSATSATSASSTPIGVDANGNPVYLSSSGAEVDASGNPDSVVGAVGSPAESYTNPAPIASSTTTATGTAPSTDQQWTADVVQDLQNLGYDGQTVATAVSQYLSSQPLTPAQVTIIRTAWSYEGRPPGEPNLPIIQQTTTGTGGTTGTGTTTTTVAPLKAGEQVQVPTQFTTGQPTWAAIAKKAGISAQHLQDNNPTVTQQLGAQLNVPVLVTASGPNATWQSIAEQWGISASHLQLNNPTIVAGGASAAGGGTGTTITSVV